MSAQSTVYNPTQTTSAATGDGFSVPRTTTAGRLAIPFTTLDAGMMVYDTTLNNLFIWTGAAWESVPASGDAGANGSVQYNDNGVVSGAANFFWDKTNNRVGIGTATPVNTLEVVAPAGDNIVSTFRSGDATAANNAGGGFRSISSATAANRVAQVWLDADGANFSGGDYFFIQKNGGSGTVEFNQSSNAAMVFLTNSTERMRIDSSGNVGIGVTPSAWSSGLRAINLSTNGVLYANGGNSAFFGNNYYNDGGGTNRYLTNNVATAYGQVSGAHQWFTAPAGIAGNVAAFTQAMTLDASGRLLVGSTSAFTDLTGSKEVKIGDGGIQTFASAIAAATPTNIARGGVGGLVYVGGFNGAGQYGAVVLWTSASATVVSQINNTGSIITFGVSAGFLQITSSLALTTVGANCIRL